MTGSRLPTNDHFTLEELADGVFAAIAEPNGGAFSNAGIIDLGEHTLVFDAFETPQAASELRQAADLLIGNRISHVIISHEHFDHWGGIQSFGPEPAVISTHSTRQFIIAGEQDPDATMENFLNDVHQGMQAALEKLQNETNPRQRLVLEASISRSKHLIAAIPEMKFRFPDTTFSHKMEFHGSKRSAVLISDGGGHTASDSYLVLPQENIIFTGDLCFFQCHPYLGSSDVPTWKNALKYFENEAVDVFVPGHGPLGSIDEIIILANYLAALESLAVSIKAQGGSIEDAARQPLPAPFDAWTWGINRFEDNMRYLYQHYA